MNKLNVDITAPVPSTEELEIRWQEDQIRQHLNEIERKAKRLGRELERLPRAAIGPYMKESYVEHFDNIIGLLQQMIATVQKAS